MEDLFQKPNPSAWAINQHMMTYTKHRTKPDDAGNNPVMYDFKGELKKFPLEAVMQVWLRAEDMMKTPDQIYPRKFYGEHNQEIHFPAGAVYRQFVDHGFPATDAVKMVLNSSFFPKDLPEKQLYYFDVVNGTREDEVQGTRLPIPIGASQESGGNHGDKISGVTKLMAFSSCIFAHGGTDIYKSVISILGEVDRGTASIWMQYLSLIHI